MSRANDWRADNYRWRQNCAKQHVKRITSFHVDKYSFSFSIESSDKPNNGFRRFGYVSSVTPNTVAVIVHYMGDSTIAQGFPHGNAKRQNAPKFGRTAPSVLQTFASRNLNAAKVYKDVISKVEDFKTPQMAPRDLKQRLKYKM